MHPKPVCFLGDTLRGLRELPQSARRALGHQIDRLQQGLQPDDFRPMPSIGLGVEEIRTKDRTGAYRIIYVARRREAVFVLHVFKKKTERTTLLDLALARQQLASISRSTPWEK